MAAWKRTLLVVTLATVSIAGVTTAQTILYVDNDALLGGDGLTWPTAFRYLQDALSLAAEPDSPITQIRAGQGIYSPDRDEAGNVTLGDRDATFQLINGVGVYGGYAGLAMPEDPDNRNVVIYVTVLSGDVNDDDVSVACTADSPDCDSFGRLCVDSLCVLKQNRVENSLHVVTGSGTNASAVLDGVTVSGGRAIESPGEVRTTMGGGVLDIDGSPTLTDCTIQGNTAGEGGGVYNKRSSPTLVRCTIRRNWAWGRGAGMYNHEESAPFLTECIFSENVAAIGGGMYNYTGAKPTLARCAFNGNTALVYYGGGMYNEWQSLATLMDCTFTGNSAAMSGGGMYNGGANPTLTHCTFSENSAEEHGGGMMNWEASPTLTNCIFELNSGSRGPGMYNFRRSHPTLNGCTFTENGNDSSGAAMTNWEDCSPVLTDCLFRRNIGGGMTNWDHCSPMLTSCTFRDNIGSGMVNRDWSSPTLVDCSFIGNATEFWGAGLYNSDFCNPRLTNCRFLGNRANGYQMGGGGMCNSDDATPTLLNCIFSGNVATNADGGGMYNEDGSNSDHPVLTNCTFSRNSAPLGFGGGIFNKFGHRKPTVTNCILWENSDLRGTGELSQIFDGNSAVSNTCIQGLDVFTGDGNIGDNPRFVDADGPDDVAGTNDDDLRLRPSSPCVDAGDSQAVPPDTFDLDGDGDTTEATPLDLFGNPRFVDDPCVADTGESTDLGFPKGAIVDMGAYEHPDDSSDDSDDDGIANCQDNCPLTPNPEQEDCDADGLGDVCALGLRVSEDCNGNEIPDECDLESGHSVDDDGNGRPDDCQRLIYVDDDAPSGGNGVSWSTAFRSLQDALEIAGVGDVIHVAMGTYTPAEGCGDRLASFELISGVSIFGGYAGLDNPDHADERDVSFYETVLSGDLNGDDVGAVDDQSRSENSYHVVLGRGLDPTAILDGVTVSGGNANGTVPYDRGGGLLNLGSSPTLIACTFANNSADKGGGMSNDRFSEPTLLSCTFADNSAFDGGGMYNMRQSHPSLTDCEFVNNTAGQTGGGIYNNNFCAPIVTKCEFGDNSALVGGGMFNANRSLPEIFHSTFRANIAERDGAGMFSDDGSHPSVTNCTFQANIAGRDGGGMYNDRDSHPVISHCSFRENAAGNGGGMYNNHDSETAVVNSTFSGNSASYGGGMNNYRTAPSVVNCTFHGNSADENGGGMYNYWSRPALSNCVFSGNLASLGGGIYLDKSLSTVINCTFSSNFALNGAALALDSLQQSAPSTLRLGNSILWNGGDEIWNNDGSTVNATYSAVQDEVSADGGVYPGEGNIDVNPLFVDADGTDGVPGTEDDRLRLSNLSPCIDSGDNTAVPDDTLDLDNDDDVNERTPLDLSGQSRFEDHPLKTDTGVSDPPGYPEVVDIGAYEHHPSNPPTGAIDARQPTDLDGTNPEGWISIEIVFDYEPEGIKPSDFTLSVAPDGPTPEIVKVSVSGYVATVLLDSAILPGTWTQITHVNKTSTSVCLGYLPGDVTGNGGSGLLDILRLIDCLNSVAACTLWQCDINRTNECNAMDILRVIDLLNGAEAFNAWNGVSLGASPCE